MAAQQLLLLLPLPLPSRTFSKPLPSLPIPLPALRLRRPPPRPAPLAPLRDEALRWLAKDKQWQGRRPNGIFWILLLNVGIYVADHLFQIEHIKAMYLYHAFPSWFQFVTSTFCHANWNHLSSNLFFVYIFGKLVEEEEGSFALWMSYILTGAGSNLISWLVLPTSSVSLGASGAVFGLFTISVLVKMSWDWRKILEVLILGQFVVDKVMEAARATTVTGHSLQVNNIAHLSGALIGAALVFLINRIPFPSDGDSSKSSKDTREKRS
uniref:Peptidase S54 rhomboid domain-containing protein n=1 Tax=Oryza barthii TaxID=65489 RepID=A0A0D3G4M4_9ORYZ